VRGSPNAATVSGCGVADLIALDVDQDEIRRCPADLGGKLGQQICLNRAD
jgi:hypothetical protein